MKTSEQDIKQQLNKNTINLVINFYILERFLTPFYIQVKVYKHIEIRI